LPKSAPAAPFRLWDPRPYGMVVAVEFVTDFDCRKSDADSDSVPRTPRKVRPLILLSWHPVIANALRIDGC
jgi:hypothetical protein